ncbi:hypothetical protein [Sinomonas gamaensis]|uniref:hypothetical protein n=1 Tax=Sinomonas gamaensis TaxID=2565624 RepID=UPI001109B45D|nr:hypothetical protein [Sinomonas gamaensis]
MAEGDGIEEPDVVRALEQIPVELVEAAQRRSGGMVIEVGLGWTSGKTITHSVARNGVPGARVRTDADAAADALTRSGEAVLAVYDVFEDCFPRGAKSKSARSCTC